jgi:hypothetical protein
MAVGPITITFVPAHAPPPGKLMRCKIGLQTAFPLSRQPRYLQMFIHFNGRTLKMRPQLRTVVIAGFFFAFLCAAKLQAAGDAVVNGLVVTSDGQEAPSAQVTAIPVMTSGQVGRLSWTKTNGHGQFQLVLTPGHYQIRAKAEADGYPDPNALFSVDPRAQFPTISVAQSDISGVIVMLGAKGGILIGEIRDQQSHGAISQSKVVLRDVRNPDGFVELTSDSQGRFQFTVPNKPVTILATAAGYQTLQFMGGKPITLSGGEQRKITLEMNRQR